MLYMMDGTEILVSVPAKAEAEQASYDSEAVETHDSGEQETHIWP